MTHYGVVERPCPDCDMLGYQRLEAFDQRTWLLTTIEVNCGRCLTTGWIEEYKHGPDEGSSVAVEVPDSCGPSGAGGRPIPV